MIGGKITNNTRVCCKNIEGIDLSITAYMLATTC